MASCLLPSGCRGSVYLCVSKWALHSSGWGESFLEGACLVGAVGGCVSDLGCGVSDGGFHRQPVRLHMRAQTRLQPL